MTRGFPRGDIVWILLAGALFLVVASVTLPNLLNGGFQEVSGSGLIVIVVAFLGVCFIAWLYFRDPPRNWR